jgi:hypothetical protein
MDDQKKVVYIADRVEAFFALDHAVLTDDYVRVAEDPARLVKADPPRFTIFARSLPSSHSKRTVIRDDLSIYSVATICNPGKRAGPPTLSRLSISNPQVVAGGVGETLLEAK